MATSLITQSIERTDKKEKQTHTTTEIPIIVLHKCLLNLCEYGNILRYQCITRLLAHLHYRVTPVLFSNSISFPLISFMHVVLPQFLFIPHARVFCVSQVTTILRHLYFLDIPYSFFIHGCTLKRGATQSSGQSRYETICCKV